MEQRTLGRGGPSISVVGYGAWQAGGTEWGANESDAHVIRSIHAALDAGMNWVDTAEVYGAGRSEELVGRALAGRRESAFVFTKVAPDEEGTGLRPDEVRRAIRGSLARLRLDHVDLYQVHWRDDRIPIEETWSAMAELVRDGAARFVGVSNFDLPLVDRCLAIHHVQSVQNQLSLLRQQDLPMLPELAARGVGFLAFSPLAKGLLSGRITRETTFADDDWRSGKSAGDVSDPSFGVDFERNLERVERLRAVAGRIDVPLSVLAVRWVLEQPGVTAAITGSRSAEHQRENAEAGDVTLPRSLVDELTQLA